MSRLDRVLPEKSEGTVRIVPEEGVEPVIFTVGLVPLFGFVVALGSLSFAFAEWNDNQFNIARQAAYTSYWVLFVQTLYLVVGLAAYGGVL